MFSHCTIRAAAMETMADALAGGARLAGARVDVKRVAETVPKAVAKASYFKLDQAAPIATPADLPKYDAIVSALQLALPECPTMRVLVKNKLGQMLTKMIAYLNERHGTRLALALVS